MKLKREFWILAVLFVFVLAIRLFFAFQTPEFSSDDTYYTLRQVESITKTGMPILFDELSYGGKDQILLPGYHYILAFFNIFLPIKFAAKVLPNIFASCLIIVIYFLCFEITKNKNSALAAAFASAFLPIFISQTANTGSVYSLVIPLLFLLLYYFIKLDSNERYIYPFLAIFVLLSFIHSSLFILVAGLLVYLLIRTLEKLKIRRSEIELTIFSAFLVLWFLFLFFKKALLAHGFFLVWQNIPKEILSAQFLGFNMVTSLYDVGLIPLIAGAYIVYRHLQKERRKPIMLFIGLSIAVVLLLFSGFIRLSTGLMFFGVILSVLFGIFFNFMTGFIERTKFSGLKNVAIVILLMLVFLTSFVPALIKVNRSVLAAPSKEKVDAILWLEKNTPQGSTVLSKFGDGSLIAYYSKRRNVIDSNFILAENAEQRLSDVNTIFRTAYKTNAIRLLNQYSVDYILLSKQQNLRYTKDDDTCFGIVYDNKDWRILRSACIIEEIKR